ncbi:TerD family protein [Streptomyces sp. SS7]|uniref:TerD family protein n=1 Tax=Streptomyces sp. SS7 TaxID=3108485 RepID=UPI0030EB9D03
MAQAPAEELIEARTDAAPRIRTPRELAGQIHAALAEQTVQVPGTASGGETISGLAESLAVLLKRRQVLETRMTALLEAHPLAKVLTSMPGGAVRTGARILAEVGDALSISQTGSPTRSFTAPDFTSGESVAVLAELYRRDGGWKIRAVGQGYASGLAGLATDYGVDALTGVRPPHPRPSGAGTDGTAGRHQSRCTQQALGLYGPVRPGPSAPPRAPYGRSPGPARRRSIGPDRLIRSDRHKEHSNAQDLSEW